MTTDSLITKYRPQTFDEVWGHKEIVTSLKNVLAKKQSRNFLFIGPTGIGKTTFAFLVADYFNARANDDFNAGVKTGIDDTTDFIEGLRYRPIDGQNQCYILNEVQSFSKKAWDSLLELMETPPSWLYFCLTTTEGHKVPDTIKGRCVTYQLKPMLPDDLIDLLEALREAEQLNTPDNIIGLCARNANGSPRLAISNFSKCASAVSIQEAQSLLEEVEAESEAIDLIRALVAGKGWAQIRPILQQMKNANPESVRHVCRAYLTTAILASKDDPIRLSTLLEHFAYPFPDKDQITPVVHTVLRYLYAKEE